MADPQVRASLPNLPFDIHEILNPGINDDDKDEEEQAKAGKPTSSKPVKVAPKKVPDPEVEKPREKVPPEVIPEEPKHETPPAPPDAALPASVINSSTHRKEHARLSRRVASMDADKFPEVHRLWGGNRKDTITFLFGVFPPLFSQLMAWSTFYYGLLWKHCFTMFSFSEFGLLFEERSDLLRSWINSGECLEATESSLVISKEQSGEMEKGKELLTIKEMCDKGFSQSLIHCSMFVCKFLFVCSAFLI